MKLLAQSSLRRARARPGSPLLAVLGVALGVAVVLGIDLANAAALRAMQMSVARVAGNATHGIVGSGSIDADLLRRVRVELGEREAAPVVERDVALADRPGEVLRLLGLDPFCEAPFRPYLGGANSGFAVDLDRFLTTPGAVLLGAETAARLGVDVGGSFDLRIGADRRTATLVGTLEGRDDFDREVLRGLLIADIGTAQALIGEPDRLTRIDLRLPPGSAGAQRVARLEAALGPSVRIEASSERAGTLERLTRGFRLNLEALARLALVVGAFLVYNALSFSVVERREEFGLLRTLGATRSQITRQVLLEATVTATLGVTLGTLLGSLLGLGLVGLVLRTINDLYFNLEVGQALIAPESLLRSGLLGLSTAAVAVAAPLREVLATPSHRARQRSTLEERARARVRTGAWLGLVGMTLGTGVLLSSGRSIEMSYVGLFLALIGFALATPFATDRLLALVESPLARRGGSLWALALRGARRSLSRTAVAIAALAVALAATIGVAVLVSSFRGTVVQWLGSALAADVFVAPPSLTATRSTGAIDAALVERLLATDGVAASLSYRGRDCRTSVGEILVVGVGIDRAQFDRYLFSEGSADRAWSSFVEGEAVLVTEPLAFHDSLTPGDRFGIDTLTGRIELPIAGVIRDYASDRGVALLHLDRFRQLFDDRDTSSLALTVAPGTEPDELIERLRARLLPGERLEIRSNRSLRRETLEIFDRTFAVTSVLRALTLLVALVGVFSALSALGLDARRELATMRAVGMTPRQLAQVLAAQAALLGACAGLLALPLGLALAWAMVEVINRQAFGWTLLDLTPPVGALLGAVVASVAVALAASIWPTRRSVRRSVIEGLREE